MKIQMLPSSFEASGAASARQHLSTLVIDDRVAIDAGSLAFACSDIQRAQIRDVVISHTHLDHIAGLPLFIDDLFAVLTEPIRVHASSRIAEVLERDIFNWSIYPRFSELSNQFGPVLEYKLSEPGRVFRAAHLHLTAIPVNHPAGASGFIIENGEVAIAVSGDTAETAEFWKRCHQAVNLQAIIVECAFPDELEELARLSEHLTPGRLREEVAKIPEGCPVYVNNIKPMYREQVVRQLEALKIGRLEILEVGRCYEFSR
jgi:ribonuclease BN (tRNA processing enzyme)